MQTLVQTYQAEIERCKKREKQAYEAMEKVIYLSMIDALEWAVRQMTPLEKSLLVEERP